MPDFISAKQAAEKWGISRGRVTALCQQNRIDGAMKGGGKWLIPATADKPVEGNTGLRPFVKWAGGKSQLVGEIEKLLPAEDADFTKYCEPMVGGGALLFDLLSKRVYEEYYISDINPELINAYRVIKDNVEGLIEKLSAMQTSFLKLGDGGRKKYYYAVRDRFNSLELNDASSEEKAAYFIFLNKTCFNGLYRVNRKGLFNVPVGRYKNPTVFDAENLRGIHNVLQNVTVVCGDYSQSKQFIDKNTFVYIDPPYRPLSSTANFTFYNADVFNNDQQLRLAGFIGEINSTGARIVLSNSDPKNTAPKDNFFDELYKEYNIKRVSVNRFINSKADRRGRISELLIYN